MNIPKFSNNRTYNYLSINTRLGVEMKKYINISFQIIIGFIPMVLWCFGYLINDTYGHYEDTTIGMFFSSLPYVVSVLIPICLCFLIVCFSVICKKFNLRALFWSAFLYSVIPIIGYGVICICSDDSSIFSLLLFPVLLILRPFGIMCMGTIDNITISIYDVFFASLGNDFWVGLLIVSLILSLVLYKLLKPITRNKTVENDDNQTNY